MEGNTVSSIDSDGLRVIGDSDLSKFEELGDNFVELVAFGNIRLVSNSNTKFSPAASSSV